MKNKYEMTLADIPYEATSNGSKTIEVRLLDSKRDQIKIGDTLIFHKSHSEESVCVEIVSIRIYKNFLELVMKETFGKTGGIYKNTDDWISNLNSYYSNEKQTKHRAIVLEFKRIN